MELKRDIDPVLLAEYAKPLFFPVALVFIDAPSGPTRLHSGVGDLPFDGHTWLGLGRLGALDIPPEVSGSVPDEARLGIVGPVDLMLAEADIPEIRGRQVDIYAGCTTTAGGTVLVGTPHRPFTGSMGKTKFQLSDDRQTASVVAMIKSGQPARSGAQIAHSGEDQQAIYPGDTFFRRVTNAAKWAQSPSQFPAS